MSSLAEQYPKEQARLRELLKLYREIGAPGMFGAAMIERTLAEADEAIASGDLTSMIIAFQKMKECE